MMENKYFKLNTVGRDFVIGDLHGRYDLLTEKMNEVNFSEGSDRLFSVGDLIDRGLENMECLRLIEKPWFHAVKGNHEDMMIDTVINHHGRDLWEYNGGEWNRGVNQSELYDLAKEAKLLPYSITVETSNGDIGISHAQPPTNDWKDVIEPSEYNIKIMLWARDIVNRDDFVVENVKATIHGHTPLTDIGHVGNCIFIDTGAFYTGKLTMINLNEIEIIKDSENE